MRRDRMKCVCGHHQSAHSWNPRKCVVPNCTCEHYKSTSEARAEKREAVFQQLLAAERARYRERDNMANNCRKDCECKTGEGPEPKKIGLTYTETINEMEHRARVLRDTVAKAYTSTAKHLMRREAATWVRAARMLRDMEEGE